MKVELEKTALPEEEHLCFSDAHSQTEYYCIGHLRADFGSGEMFYFTWFDHSRSERNDELFKHCFDETINNLRETVLHSRSSLSSYCYGKMDCRKHRRMAVGYFGC